jgi:hypothetical protein
MLPMPNNVAKVFYVLDFDRTLVNTDKLYDILKDVLEKETNSDVSRLLDVARIESEEAGGSFETIDYLRRLLAEGYHEDAWPRVQRAFNAQAQHEDALEPGAKELLGLLADKSLLHGIITFGNEAWQLAKLEATGLLAMPYLVTSIKEKGLLLSGWKHHSDSSFIIPPAMTRDFTPVVVESIVFLDDKAVSFQDLPTGVQGVFVRSPSGELLPSQEGALPEGVTSVVGLSGAIELLFPAHD